MKRFFLFLTKNSSSKSSPPDPPSYSSVSVSLPFSTPRDLDSYSPITFPSSSPPILPSTSPSSLPPTPSSSPAELDVNLALTPPHIHPMRTRSQNNVQRIRQLTDGIVRYPLPRALLAESALIEPTCFSNAAKVSEWLNAMQVEFNALLKNQTWSLVPSSTANNVISSKWVFKLK